MKLDALDTAALGAYLREATEEMFWDWLDHPDGCSMKLTDEERRARFEDKVVFLRHYDDRDFGERMVEQIERLGFRIERNAR